MPHFQSQKVSKQQATAGVYRVPDSVQLDQEQITDVSELVPVHLWLDLTSTICCDFMLYFAARFLDCKTFFLPKLFLFQYVRSVLGFLPLFTGIDLEVDH